MGQTTQQVSKQTNPAVPTPSVLRSQAPVIIKDRGPGKEGTPRDIELMEKVAKFFCKLGSKVPVLKGICKTAEYSQKIGAQKAWDMQSNFEDRVNKIPLVRGIYNFFWKLAPGDMENGWEKK